MITKDLLTNVVKKDDVVTIMLYREPYVIEFTKEAAKLLIWELQRVFSQEDLI